MPSCDPFTVTVPGDLDTTLQRVKNEIESRGGTFTGDVTGGSASGSIPLLGHFAATYAVAGDQVTITVTQRPLLLPCATIKAQAERFLANP
jgi:hypothetical protein